MKTKTAIIKMTLPVLCLFLLLSSCTTTYLGRYVDLLVFKKLEKHQTLPSRLIQSGDMKFTFIEDEEFASRFSGNFTEITYRTKDEIKSMEFSEFLEQSETVAFMAIKDDTIIREDYFGGYSRTKPLTSYSVAKSFTSALIGIAVENGLIESIEDPVRKYLPEFDGEGLERITIRHLLIMSSGLEHSAGLGPGKDFIKSGIHPNIREKALKQKKEKEPGESWWYNNYHTLLLGMILERVSGKTPSRLLEEQIWVPLGMEYDATWNLDKSKDGFEVMALGLNASIIDYAKFARLYLNNGNWNGKQIVSSEWVAESTTTDPSMGNKSEYYINGDDEYSENFQKQGGYYAYQWWGYKNDDGTYEYYAYGILGQYLYIVPEKNLILIRFGEDYGDVYWWPEVLKDLAARF